MADRPAVKEGDWIRVGKVDCVVSRLLPHDPSADCEVVFNASKPINIDVKWQGARWKFVECGDFGGYSDRHRHLVQYVIQLKAGRGR